jgi:hypothetical protein
VSHASPAVVGALLSALGAPLAVAAQSPSGQASGALATVEVTVGAIVANNSREWLDHRVVALNPRVPSLFPYSSFRMVGEERRSVPWGGKVQLDLSGNRHVVVVPREIKNHRVSVRIRLVDRSRAVLDTIVALQNRGTLLVGGPPETDGVLILAIGAATLQ